MPCGQPKYKLLIPHPMLYWWRMSTPAQSSQRGFQEPKYVDDPQDCLWYHTTELPGLGLQMGHWDLRNDVDRYLGNVDFRGKRVIDVGTASGYLAFEMEKRGAEVIAFDRLMTDGSDDAGLVPFHDYVERFGETIDDTVKKHFEMQRRMQNSFWLAHRLRNSKVKYYCANAYDNIRDIGEVDYVFYGCVLLHLRDPLLALSRFAPLAREKLIITEMHENIGPYGEGTVMFLRPNIKEPQNTGTWWYMTPALLERYLEILGFRKFDLSKHKGTYAATGKNADLFTLVASR